jgi:hypothetical protein
MVVVRPTIVVKRHGHKEARSVPRHGRRLAARLNPHRVIMGATVEGTGSHCALVAARSRTGSGLRCCVVVFTGNHPVHGEECVCVCVEGPPPVSLPHSSDAHSSEAHFYTRGWNASPIPDAPNEKCHMSPYLLPFLNPKPYTLTSPQTAPPMAPPKSRWHTTTPCTSCVVG